MANERISIVIPTIGRSTELDALLRSIARSTYRDYEIIVVDQNHPRMLDDLILKHQADLPIVHLKVDFAGAAKARNYGSAYAKGKYLFFPDDDAELFPDTLAGFIEYSQRTGADVIFGRCQDRSSADSVAVFSRKSGYLSLKRHLTMFIESTMFVKKDIFANFLFDESFGVGTFHGADEAYDIVLRMLHENISMYYTPDIKVYHPSKVINHVDATEIRRVFTYRCGFAHLCMKHKLYQRYYARLFKVVLYIPYTMIAAPGKTRYYLSELLGLLTGVVIR